MKRKTRLFLWATLAIIALAGGWALWFFQNDIPPIVRQVPRQGGLDVTLLAASDLHFGAQIVGRDDTLVDALPVRQEMTRQMNQMRGKAYPQTIGGTVGTPASLVISGDLTEDGTAAQWREFTSFYGLGGKDSGNLGSPALGGLPVYECIGNHDEHGGTFVTQQVAERHGGDYYAIDYGDLRVICLSQAPTPDGLKWLRRKLADTGRDRPVILYMHLPMLGPYSRNWWAGSKWNLETFGGIVGGFNIVAILHGHYHVPGHYQWRGIDVYNIGSIKHGARCFGVVHVTDTTFTFASWNFQQSGWWWWHSKPINGTGGATAKPVEGSKLSPGLFSRPAIPYPLKAS